ncbi:MAG: hypothetical protein JKY48_00335 [Flavobacteriales bacterium]|nr:hypothetical protein [Flavobacteriales bacterium]
MSIQDKRVELVVLIDNIKEHSDQLNSLETIPFLELSVILSKISELHEKVAVLKYLSSVEQKHSDEELIISSDEVLSEEDKVEEQGDLYQMNESMDEESQELVSEMNQEIAVELNEESVFSEIVEETPLEEEEESHVVEALQQETIISEDEVESEPIQEETTSIEDHSEELVFTPSDTILESLLKEVREEESDKEELTSNELEPVDEPLNEELIEKIENETELNAVPDLNEVLSKKDDSLSNQLQKQSITDILSAIGLNERYLYSNELFNGDMGEFKNALTMLNEFKTGDEARAFFENGLRASYAWEDDNVLAQALFNLVERRFQ